VTGHATVIDGHALDSSTRFIIVAARGTNIKALCCVSLHIAVTQFKLASRRRPVRDVNLLGNWVAPCFDVESPALAHRLLVALVVVRAVTFTPGCRLQRYLASLGNKKPNENENDVDYITLRLRYTWRGFIRRLAI
jgi:hypothetical protein